MDKRKYSYIGTAIAVITIVLLVILAKLVFKEDLSGKETVFEPTEAPTVQFFENTQLSALPAE